MEILLAQFERYVQHVTLYLVTCVLLLHKSAKECLVSVLLQPVPCCWLAVVSCWIGREGALFIYIGLFLAWGREKRAFRFWPRVSGLLILEVEPSDNLQSRDKITEVQSDTRWPQEAIQRCSLHSNGKWS